MVSRWGTGLLQRYAANAETDAPIGTNRPAFVNRNTGWPNFITSLVNLQTVPCEPGCETFDSCVAGVTLNIRKNPYGH